MSSYVATIGIMIFYYKTSYRPIKHPMIMLPLFGIELYVVVLHIINSLCIQNIQGLVINSLQWPFAADHDYRNFCVCTFATKTEVCIEQIFRDNAFDKIVLLNLNCF